MMGWTPPTASMRQSEGVKHHLREASVSEVIIVGLDIAKYVLTMVVIGSLLAHPVRVVPIVLGLVLGMAIATVGAMMIPPKRSRAS